MIIISEGGLANVANMASSITQLANTATVIHEEPSRKYVTKELVNVSASQGMVELGATNANQVIGAIQTVNHAVVVIPEVLRASAHQMENVPAYPISQAVLATSAHQAITDTPNASVVTAIHRDRWAFLVTMKDVVSAAATLMDRGVIAAVKDFTTILLAKIAIVIRRVLSRRLLDVGLCPRVNCANVKSVFRDAFATNASRSIGTCKPIIH